MSDYTVGPDFAVKVTFHDAPVSAAKIVIRRANPEDDNFVATRDTDSRGTAEFFAIPPGSYRANIESGLLSPDAEFKVDANPLQADSIELQWPAESLAVRSLRGKLVKAENSKGKIHPFRHASVELLDLRSGNSIAKETTSSSGDYSFSAVARGLYVLRVSPSVTESDSHDTAIEILPDASQEHIPPLRVEKTDCMGVQVSPLELKDGRQKVKAASN